ncbi:unnamed protein product [Cuscuta campestris]|uniref:Uncharacterized protein n=1 Tax=Cuscuta campestris TaxID=132261 RepID=A0A484KSR2_9ASTE|nr:unnamed protein product [Cuscuta campestris]
MLEPLLNTPCELGPKLDSTPTCDMKLRDPSTAGHKKSEVDHDVLDLSPEPKGNELAPQEAMEINLTAIFKEDNPQTQALNVQCDVLTDSHNDVQNSSVLATMTCTIPIHHEELSETTNTEANAAVSNEVDEQSEAEGITNCFDFNTTKDTKDEHSIPDSEVGSVAAQYEMENLTKAAALEHTQEQSNEESMDGMTAQNARYVGNTIILDEFPVLTRQNIEEDVHIPTENVEAVVHTPTEIEKDDTTGTPTLKAEDATKENTIPNNSDVNPANIGPILHSFEHEGQLYEIRSHIEEGQMSNHNDENHTTHEFQEVQNRRSRKKQAMPRTIKTRSYDPNLEVDTVSEITRYWPSRKSTTMEKIVTTKTYSGPFCSRGALA